MDSSASSTREPQAPNPNRSFKLVELLDAPTSSYSELVRSAGLRGLHFGSGANVLAEWLNTDMVRLGDLEGNLTERDRLARVNGDLYYLQHDATERFPLEDGSFDWIYSEHFIEHLSPEQGVEWLQEVRRLLRPGGHARITTPDLRRYVTGYLDPDHELFA
jgi:SAM-dependent methyltransferase